MRGRTTTGKDASGMFNAAKLNMDSLVGNLNALTFAGGPYEEEKKAPQTTIGDAAARHTSVVSHSRHSSVAARKPIAAAKSGKPTATAAKGLIAKPKPLQVASGEVSL